MNEGTRHSPWEKVGADWLEELPCRVGQLFVDRTPEGKVTLCHREDIARRDLVMYATADAAVDLARYDDAGDYRPLKTAPNLRHGWMLALPDLRAAVLAVDLFYPGRAAAFWAWRKGELKTTSFRETLARQTGLYRIAARITDEQADELVGGFCRSDGGCLRTIFWKKDIAGGIASSLLPSDKFDPRFDQTGRGEMVLPLLCQESCNLLVAAARDVVKAGG